MDELTRPIEPRIEEQPLPKKHPFLSFMWELLQILLLAVVAYFGINFVTERIRVESISMEPTLHEGNFVMVNKLAYHWGEPDHGDVVVFKYPLDPDGTPPYIKRIVGLPGDVVVIKNGVVTVNGQALEEPYIMEAPRYDGKWTVPGDSLFVLGDNRNRSSDSRIWGMVPYENVIGKALFTYWPPENWRLLRSAEMHAAAP